MALYRPTFTTRPRLSAAFELMFLIPLLVGRCDATTVIAVFQLSPTGWNAVLAADSLESGSVGTYPLPPRAVCKLKQAEGFYFATAGPSWNSPRTFDVDRAMLQALSLPGTFEEKMKAFERRIVQEMNVSVDWPEDTRMPQVLVIDSTNPARHYLGNINRHGDTPWVVLGDSGVRTAAASKIIILGRADHIYLRENFPSRPISESLIELIQQEAKEHPHEIGEPVSVVLIKEKDSQWIQRGSCASQ